MKQRIHAKNLLFFNRVFLYPHEKFYFASSPIVFRQTLQGIIQEEEESF